ncbi:MAG: LysR substrate-binding domain-containing protein [Acidimicrobiales bacterium]
MFDVRRLLALQAVAHHGTLSSAAESLHFTPSAISQQLAALEREAGCKLLVRKGRGVELTESGRMLAAHADTVLDQLTAARAALDDLRGRRQGVVRLAAFPTAVTSIVVGALERLAVSEPDVSVRISEVEPDQALRLLTDGAVDLAIIHTYDLVARALPARTTINRLFDDPMVVALPAAHPLAEDARVDITALADEPWVTPASDTWCFEQVQRVCGAAGFVPDVVATCSEYSSALRLVRAGLGVALVPELALPGRRPDGVVVLPTTPAHMRHVHLAAAPSLSAAATAVSDALRP